MKLIWKLLRQHISVAQLAGFLVTNLFGIAIILSAIQLYEDTLPIVNSPDSFMKNDYLILSKQVNPLQAIGVGSSDFTAEELDEIDGKPFVSKTGIFTPAHYRILASISAAGMDLATDLFFESVPNEFIDVESNEWVFSEEDRTVPIIIPRNYLNLYNFGFAQSQGLPQISQHLFGAITFDLRITGNDQREYFKGRIAGFSNRLNTILVPQDFIEWSNKIFGDGRESGPSRIIVEVRNSADEDLHAFLKAKGYEIEGDNQDGGKTTYFLRMATAVVVGIGLLITLLSFFILMLSIFLLLQKNSRKLEDLLLLGYTPARVSLPYQLLSAGLNLGAVILAIPLVLWLRSYCLPILGSFSEKYEAGSILPTLVVGVVMAAVISLINCIVIRRKVRSLWKHK